MDAATGAHLGVRGDFSAKNRGFGAIQGAGKKLQNMNLDLARRCRGLERDMRRG